MTVTHLQFLAATHDTIAKIVQDARGEFKDEEDPLEWTLAQLSSLLQHELFATQLPVSPLQLQLRMKLN